MTNGRNERIGQVQNKIKAIIQAVGPIYLWWIYTPPHLHPLEPPTLITAAPIGIICIMGVTVEIAGIKVGGYITWGAET